MIAHVGFTGTRNGMAYLQAQAVNRWLERLKQISSLEMFPYTTFHHGDCLGADTAAHAIAVKLGYRVVIHPPVDQRYRAFMQGHEVRTADDYLVRNHHIVDESDWMVAAPSTMNEQQRSGTWATIRYAVQQECPIAICYPDGSTALQHVPGFHHEWPEEANT